MNDSSNLLSVAQHLRNSAAGTPSPEPPAVTSRLAKIGNLLSVAAAFGLALTQGPNAEARPHDQGRDRGSPLLNVVAATVIGAAANGGGQGSIGGAAVGGALGQILAGKRASPGEQVGAAVIGAVLGGAIGAQSDNRTSYPRPVVSYPQQPMVIQQAPMVPPPPPFDPPPYVIYEQPPQPRQVIYVEPPPPPPPVYVEVARPYPVYVEVARPAPVIVVRPAPVVVIMPPHGARGHGHVEPQRVWGPAPGPRHGSMWVKTPDAPRHFEGPAPRSADADHARGAMERQRDVHRGHGGPSR
jgi:hypothetical protein